MTDAHVIWDVGGGEGSGGSGAARHSAMLGEAELEWYADTHNIANFAGVRGVNTIGTAMLTTKCIANITKMLLNR